MWKARGDKRNIHDLMMVWSWVRGLGIVIALAFAETLATATER